ncbi:hypothetical protein PR202_gn00251 [Eleusine coracana subsp. coracana]|uniref:DEK-C domain-containing protein n=1 Tax=Eleusine coracana subsp. coracana TaxID=191504 RepID=A0AAV5G1G2_ELECO|nr:hypothetical protein PR202_gn00146 [Eleusine coracana subsp. coracana]GJN40938.1 hypothetical protein PR202_gn00251 [Eleusine coracana subsp. coracana]
MDCQDGAGPGSGAGEDRSKVIDLRERILQLAGHDCHEEGEKSRVELMEDLNICKRDALVELCHSFDIAGSRANRKEELVSFLMKFLKNKCSLADATIPVKEKSRTELLERLNVCKRDTLIELCRSFDLIGSRANRKEELVSFLMKFVKEHSSAMDGTNPDKKIKKRRRMKEEDNLSCGKLLKKKKQESTALETQDEEEANISKAAENRRNYSECDGKNNRYPCADIKNGEFPNEKADLEPIVRINCSISDNVEATTLNEAQITSSFSLGTMFSFVKGKKGSKGDANPRKQATKPSRDELREAIVLILDSTDFATVTFGDVVKEVDKYFGKDLFERKPLIRSLIEEELFRLSEEAEKKELEEEEAAEAKARAEQSTKEMAQVQTVGTGIKKQNKNVPGQNCKTKDCDNGHEKDGNGGSSIKRNSSDAAESLHNGIVDAHRKIGDNEPTNDSKCGKVSISINKDVDIQGSRTGEVAIVNLKNNNIDTLEGSEDDRIDACNREHDDTEYGRTQGGRSENGDNNADDINGCEAEESRSYADYERVKHVGNGKAKEASNDKSSNVAIRSDNDGKGKEGNIDVEQNPADGGGDGKAEDAVHSANTKVDVDSGKNGAAVNG